MPFIPNVNPNELIESNWGNTIRDHVVQRFADAAARNAAIPTPVDGMVCYLTSSPGLQVRRGGVWQSLPGGLLAYTTLPATTGAWANTYLPVPSLTTGFTVPAGRRIRVVVNAGVWHNAGGASTERFQLREGGTVHASAEQSVAASSANSLVRMEVVLAPTAGTHTYDTYVMTDVGTSILPTGSGVSTFVSVEDVGA